MRELRYSDYYASYDELRYGTSYVQGSNVLQLEPVRKEEKKTKTAKKPNLRIVKQRKPKKELYTRAQVMQNRMALTITVIALLAVCFSCINYLKLQAEVSGRAEVISELEEQYVSLKTENDLAEVRINSSIDYDHILDVAINELGMVYAEKDQIIVYNSQEMECVKQLSEIPVN